MKRRTFLAAGACTIAGLSTGKRTLSAAALSTSTDLPFRISLAEWSLNKSLRKGRFTNLDFPSVAKREFGIDCVEYVDQFFRDKSKDTAYLKELRRRADDEGVRSALIMIDTNGPLGVADAAKRKAAVEKTYGWIDAAKALGCHSVRVNAYGERGASADDVRGRIVESCTQLADFAAERNMNVAIENHGGFSSDPEWLAQVMREVGRPNFGTLPDFGNFPGSVDRYDAVEQLLPFAKAVSAKAMRFSPEGLVLETDFRRMMRIVQDAGYSSYVGIESVGKNVDDEFGAVLRTRDLLLAIRREQARRRPLLADGDLSKWVVVEGGEWSLSGGVLHGKNGQNWSTNPERAGSWLRTAKEYADFRLELEYKVNERGNSGVFFRAGGEKNPAFTGYEMQIYDAPGRPPSKKGPGSLYDLVAPMENRVRPAGQWNRVTIVCRGPRISVDMNGVQVLATEQTRSLRGYIGLQNHDERSQVWFRNVRVEEL